MSDGREYIDVKKFLIEIQSEIRHIETIFVRSLTPTFAILTAFYFIFTKAFQINHIGGVIFMMAITSLVVFLLYFKLISRLNFVLKQYRAAAELFPTDIGNDSKIEKIIKDYYDDVFGIRPKKQMSIDDNKVYNNVLFKRIKNYFSFHACRRFFILVLVAVLAFIFYDKRVDIFESLNRNLGTINTKYFNEFVLAIGLLALIYVFFPIFMTGVLSELFGGSDKSLPILFSSIITVFYFIVTFYLINHLAPRPIIQHFTPKGLRSTTPHLTYILTHRSVLQTGSPSTAFTPPINQIIRPNRRPTHPPPSPNAPA